MAHLPTVHRVIFSSAACCAVAALRTNVYLRELYLADNKMLPADGAQIAMLLKSNHTIEVLDLRNNQLQARLPRIRLCALRVR